MSEDNRTILIVGPTPPPFHGVAVNTRALLDCAIINRDFDLVHLDTADRRTLANLGRFDWTNVWLALKHAVLFAGKLVGHRPRVVYVPICQNTLGFLRDCLFMLPAIFTGRKLVLHLRGGYFRRFYETAPSVLKSLIRYILAHTSRVIVLGNTLRYIFEGLIADERIAVIPNGLDPEPFERLRTQARPARDGYQVTYLGSLQEGKGYQFVLRAAPVVLNQLSDVHFTWAGSFRRPDEAAWCKEFIQEHHLEGTTSFPGVITGDEKVRLLLSSDLFVFPTQYDLEGHPMVVLEAMAAGLPCITTDQGAIRETVLDGVNGFIIPKGDVAAIADRILLLLTNDELRQRMGQASLKRFQAHYTLDRWAPALVQVFQHAVKER